MNPKDEIAMDRDVVQAEAYDLRAHRTLTAIYEDGQQRIAEIESQISRLGGEREAILGVLGRIAPPAPTPISNGPAYGSGSAVPSRSRSW